MAGIQVLPSLDQFAGLRQGANNLVGGLIQQQQQGAQLSDQEALLQFIQQRRAGGNPQAPQFQTAQGAGGLASFIGGQPTDLQQRGAEASINLANAQAEKARTPVGISPSQQLTQKKLDAIELLERKKTDGTITPTEQALLDKGVIGGGGINIDFSKGQLLSAATSLRSEFNSDQRVKDFRILAPKFKNMLSFIDRSISTGRKGPTDIALSKTFQKLTDLMSSVREGEYETTFRGQSLLEKIEGGIKALKTGGEGMTPGFRQEIVDTARLMFEDGKVFFNQAIEEKSAIADAFGIPRQQILGNIEVFPIADTKGKFESIFGLEQTKQPQQPQAQQQQGIPSLQEIRGISTPQVPINRNSITEQDLNNLTLEQLQNL